MSCFYHQLASLQVALDAGVVDADDQHDHQTKDKDYHACSIFSRNKGNSSSKTPTDKNIHHEAMAVKVALLRWVV